MTRRLAALDIFLRVKSGKMLADDFFGAVTFNPFRSRIPADDLPAGVEHKNGIVLYTFHQQTESLFALMQGRFDALSFRDIADDGHGESALLQGADHDVHREFRAVFASAIEFQYHAHGPHARLHAEVLLAGGVRGSKALGNKRLHRQSQQLCVRIRKHPFDLRIAFDNSAIRFGDNNAIGQTLK
ncbi:MAG: hypothetical protein WCA15_13010 [Candidatus Acidiferrales bacterium]